MMINSLAAAVAAQQQCTYQVEENISNLTSASNEASVSSINRNDNGVIFSPHYNFSDPLNQTQSATKKKRNQPGHPDPDAEVISLSPRALLATNRFVCEVCNKGFQRDQNLQLHRRGHNLPWKLKQRSNKDIIRKKVYVCPETSCVHHDPSRALGDLTGIKKHFCRKHGEKKWKCEKCSKKYAVQSDWKAHSKTCGTREYRCDCGTLFSRRDSFITHRAFCDALAEENVRSITATNTTINIPNLDHHHHQTQNNLQQIQSHFNIIKNPNHDHHIPIFPIKKEQNNFMMGLRAADQIPPWLSSSFPPLPGSAPPEITPTSPSIFQDFYQNQDFSQTQQNPNPNTQVGTTPTLLSPYHPPPPPPHSSATALLQKAAQMGSKSSPPSPACVFTGPHQPAHVSSGHTVATTGFGLNLSSRDGFINGLASYGNKAGAATVTGGSTTVTCGKSNNNPYINPPPHHSSLFHDIMMSNPGIFDHEHQSLSAFEDMTYGGIFSHASSKKDDEHQESLDFDAALEQFNSRNHDGMTRDFLGLKALSQSDILSIAGLSNCMDHSSTNACNNNEHHQKPASWQP